MTMERPDAETATETLRQVTTEPAEAGERLDRLLAARLAEMSRTRLKRLVEGGRVSLNGATITDPAMRVKPGQTFTVALPAPVADTPEPQALDLAIVYEDEHVIVIDKPAGLVVHPAPGNPDRTLVNALLAHCGGSLAGIGGVRRPGIVHRIDKDTSGLMVAAKTELAHARLSAAFAAHAITRSYQAVTWGVPHPAAGEISLPIGRSPHNRKKMAVVERGGKAAVTRYRMLRRFGTAAALVECRLATGRTHQIRVHMQSIGHPVCGDPEYGSPGVFGLERQFLHAARLRFPHPVTGEAIEVSSPLPEDLVQALERARAGERG